jgi:uncharacterized phage protein (TIGR01671 family)
MNDRLKWRMWSTHAGRYFDETNDAMLENVFECMKQQICYDCQNPVFRKIYDRIAYNHIADGMVFEQCTGLKDKNGKLIYENDLIKIDDDVAVINWSDYYARFILESSEDIFDFERSYAEECEVIGNIHTENINDM